MLLRFRFGVLLLFGVMLLNGSVVEASTIRPLVLRTPTRDQLRVVEKVLGTDFADGGAGAFPPKLLVSSIDLNHDGLKDMLVVQEGLCSNHACKFEVLIADEDKWKKSGELESWSIPYLESGASNAADNIITFEHLSSDCEICSDPTPCRLKYKTKNGQVGTYVR